MPLSSRNNRTSTVSSSLLFDIAEREAETGASYPNDGYDDDYYSRSSDEGSGQSPNNYIRRDEGYVSPYDGDDDFDENYGISLGFCSGEGADQDPINHRSNVPTHRKRAPAGSVVSKITSLTGMTNVTNETEDTQDSDIPNSNKKGDDCSIDNSRNTADESVDNSTDELRRLLAQRSPHLPGHGLMADWIQYMRNNHPLLGICCKYKENPIDMPQRLVMLLGSIFFGLAVTNYVYLYFRLYGNGDIVIFKMDFRGSTYELTYERAILFSLGSVAHSMIDLSIWHLAACAPCLPGGCCSCLGFMINIGRYITVGLCLIFTVAGTLSIFMRTNYDEAEAAAGEGGASVLDLTKFQISSMNSFSFLVGYCIELALVYFVYFPLLATLLFAGCIPFVGGRQREVNRQNRNKELRMSRNDSAGLLV